MNITFLYFASLREAVGRASESVEVEESVATIGGLRDWLVARGEPYASAFANAKRVRCSFNQVLARYDTPLEEGAEVAFFPPVTGG